MNKKAISLTIIAALALFGARVVHARGFGGAHGGSSSAGAYHGGGYHGGSSSAETYHASDGASAAHGARGTAVKGPDGNVYAHQSSPGQHPTGEASGNVYHAPDGATAVHGADGTVAKGPDGNVYSHEAPPGGAYYGAGGAASAHGAVGYSAAPIALPTDAGYGVPAARTGAAAYAGYHQTAAFGGAYAARGDAVRTSYNGYGMYGAAWHAANPGAWTATNWGAGRAWTPAAWPAVGASLGWDADVQPVAYNYGANITYQDDQVYCDNQPVATAEQYYQQAATLAQSAPPPDPKDPDWMPLGVFALVQNDQSEPHYVVQLAVNKAGTLAGNYSDLVSGTTVPLQGGVDKKTQRVAWTVGKNKRTVGETGLYNLTQNEAPALIHVGKDKTQQWLLVRLKQPERPSGEK